MSIRSGNPDSSIRFLDADELRQAREAQRLADIPEPICTCPTEMRIDGVDYIVRGGVYDAGCRVHNPCRSRYVPKVGITLSEMKRDGKRHGSHAIGEGA